MKRINLDQMKNMSIDNLIELYRDGYRLEEHTPITSLSDFNTSDFPNILPNIHILQSPLLDPVINFGKVTVSTGYDAAATSIILNTNEGSKLPDPSSAAFNLVWWNSTDYPDPSDDPNKEIIRCTAKTTDTLTVTRAQEGTTASVKNLTGKVYKMILSVTAKMITDISSSITARVAKSGDTMTGTLNLPSNGLIVGTDQLIVSGGNVGIGAMNPMSRLHIVSSLNEHASSLATSMSKSTTFIQTKSGSGAGIAYTQITPNVQAIQGVYSDGSESLPLVLNPYGGNIGIGTTNIGTKLHISNGAVVNGSVITLDGDSGTAAYKLGIDGTGSESALTFVNINDNERMRITNTGNVGIGTTNPSSPNSRNVVLQVGSASTTNAGLVLGHDDTNWELMTSGSVSTGAFSIAKGTNIRMHIDHNGNVGIGTTSPTATLQIASEGIFEGNVAGLTGLVIQKQGTNDRTTVGITSKGTGQYADLALFHGSDYTTNFEQYRLGYDGSGNWFYLATSKGGTGTLRSLVLDATGVGSNLFNQLYLATSGNVGIGTTSPSAKLDVSGTDAIKVPNGTTAQRPASPVAGMIRFNTTTLNFEGYTGSDWRPIVSLFAISASDNIIHAHDAAASTTSVNVIVKMKTITMGYSASGSVRIKFSLWSSSPSNTGAAGRIYKNGLPIGILRYAQTILTFSEDFNMTWLSGDTIELWGNPYTNALAIYVSDFRICAVASGGTATNS